MHKIAALVLRQLKVVMRDRMALLEMLAAPLALALVLSFAFGNISGSGSIDPVPVIVVNQDTGLAGEQLVALFQSSDLNGLVAPTVSTDVATARAAVDAGRAAAAVIAPEGLSERIAARDGDSARIMVYADPGRPVGAGIVTEIVQRFSSTASGVAATTSVTLEQLVKSGRVSPSELPALVDPIAVAAVKANTSGPSIGIQKSTVGEPRDGFSTYAAYYAPSIAVMFLMFAMTSAARGLLLEREEGTLARLRTTPTRESTILAGQIAGVVAVGLTQMVLLVLGTRLIMGVAWGNSLGVAALLVMSVLATAAMGLAIATHSRNAQQAGLVATMVVMVLAAVGGSFVSREAFPGWLRTLGYVGPNAWSIEGFQKLASGAVLGDLAGELAALAAMTIVFFVLAMWGFRRGER